MTLPGHAALLHAALSILGPEHWAPPLAGAGLVQLLVLVRVPPPHVTLHAEKAPYALHPPLTI